MAAAFLGVLILFIDQLTKYAVLKNLALGESVPVIAGIFHLSLVCNKGAAFSLFSQSGPQFLWIPIAFLISIVFILAWKRNIFWQSRCLRLYSCLILAGGLGNLIDRIRFGCVLDFLDLRIWPVFNIADSSITIGSALLILHLLRSRKTVI